MVRTCIICGKRAGSEEHIFPAALGGRRVNKGIYCGEHNKGFSHHVTALLGPLEFFNASYGVRSDHHKAPRPVEIVGNDGQRYQMLREHVEIAPPLPLTQTPELLGRKVELKFANGAQREQWLAKQRELKFDVKIESAPLVARHFTMPLQVNLEFGTEEFLCAVAYVGLTYLAHYFPTIARQDGLDAIKSYIQGLSSLEGRVWWVDPKCFPLVSKPNFRRMHTVAISVSCTSCKAIALVAFFGNILLAVDLGRVDVDHKMCITTHVNPLAEEPRLDVDINVVREPDIEIEVGTPEQGLQYLRSVVDGISPNPVVQILTEINTEHRNELVKRFRPELDLVNAIPSADERQAAVCSIIDKESQRVFNLLHAGVQGFIDDNVDLDQHLLQRVAAVIAADPSRPSGLSMVAELALAVAKTAIAHEILAQIDTGPVTDEQLGQLLFGSAGIEIVTRAVLSALA